MEISRIPIIIIVIIRSTATIIIINQFIGLRMKFPFSICVSFLLQRVLFWWSQNWCLLDSSPSSEEQTP